VIYGIVDMYVNLIYDLLKLISGDLFAIGIGRAVGLIARKI